MSPRRHLPLLVLALAMACGKNKPASSAPASAEAAAPDASAESETTPDRPDVDPIPEGWRTLTPQIVVADVDEALAFYEATFGATRTMAVAGPDGKIFHAEIGIGDSRILVERENDEWMSPKALGWTSSSLMVYVDDADKVFKKAIDAGARSQTPVDEMFWGDRFGVFTDPSGHRWAVATRVEELTDAQVTARLEIMRSPPPKKKKGSGTRKRNKKRGKPPPRWKAVKGRRATAHQPDGYHTVTIALTVPNAAAAIAFYTQAFGATERSRIPTADGKGVMHAEVEIGDSLLVLADPMPKQGEHPPKGGSSAPPLMIHQYVDDADRAFHVATGAGAWVVLATQDTFWGDRLGVVVGPDGYGWGLASQIEDLDAAELERRLQNAAGGPPPPPPEPATTPAAPPAGGGPPPPPPPPVKGAKKK
jgi:uncharacterized glyoxalase superfamily protein PhnB